MTKHVLTAWETAAVQVALERAAARGELEAASLVARVRLCHSITLDMPTGEDTAKERRIRAENAAAVEAMGRARTDRTTPLVIARCEHGGIRDLCPECSPLR